MSEEKKTPREWAAGKGLFKPPRYPWDEPGDDWRWSAADALYGWSHHAYNYQLPEQALRLSESDFDLALVAAGAYPATPPHAPAIAPSYQGRFPELFQAQPPEPSPPELPPIEPSEES